MTNYGAELTESFRAAANPEKERHLMRFFKTGKGQYSYGDQFLGLPVPAHALSSGRFEASSRLRVATACLIRPGMKSVWQRCFLWRMRLTGCKKSEICWGIGKDVSKARRGRNATNDKI
jgi:hypothetical protein